MKRILIQLDTDRFASVFDRVVASDAGADEQFSYGGVTPEDVEPLVHGAIFTRGPKDLASTAIFVGGSDVAAGEALFEQVKKTFFGPMRVSVMLDANGSNTTAAAAVLSAAKHLDFSRTTAAILGGTGPVGSRAALILAQAGANVRVVSRKRGRGEVQCRRILERVPNARVETRQAIAAGEVAEACRGASLVIAAGAAKVQFAGLGDLVTPELKVVIDVNAVPPLGVAGIEVMDKATEREGVLCYGAIGIGGRKMKIHKAAVARLFTANNLELDTTEIYELGRELG